MTSPNVAILRFSDTTPAARPLLSISVARHLDAIERFTGSRPVATDCLLSCRMHPQTSVVDPSPLARLDGPRLITGEIVSQFFIGGIADADYIVTYLITFSDSSVEAFDAVIGVRDFIGL